MTRKRNAVVDRWLSFFCGAMVLMAVAPAGAAALPAATNGFDLRLEEAVASGRLGIQLTQTAADGFNLLMDPPVPTGVGTRQEDEFADLHFSVSRVSWRFLQDTEEPAPAAPALPAKKRGRWLKRHWYVPVLAAVAVYALVEESNDNIRDGLN